MGRARRGRGRGRARRRRLRDPRLGKRLPLKPMLITGAVDAAAAVGRVRRQRRALAAGGRPDRGDAGRRRLGAPAGVPRRADRHPPDARRASSSRRVLLGIYVLGAVYVFAWRPARRRRRVEAAATRMSRRRCASASTSAAPSRRPSRSRPRRSRCARSAVVPTTHDGGRGVTEGVAAVLARCSSSSATTARASSSSPTRRRRR